MAIGIAVIVGILALFPLTILIAMFGSIAWSIICHVTGRDPRTNLGVIPHMLLGLAAFVVFGFVLAHLGWLPHHIPVE